MPEVPRHGRGDELSTVLLPQIRVGRVRRRLGLGNTQGWDADQGLQRVHHPTSERGGETMAKKRILADDALDAEMCLIVDGGCHPDCQHMQHCIRCGPCCKAVRDKLMVENL